MYTRAYIRLCLGIWLVFVVGCGGGATSTGSGATPTAPAPVGPSITTQPANQTVLVNDTASFSVAATGTAPLSYQWQKNGVAISGATSSTYTSVAALSDNTSQYRAIVTNSAGSTMSNAATLTVNPIPVGPSITTQPANQTVLVNDPASFSVVATGTAPLSYQWQKNGVAISGATSSTYTSVAALSDNGSQYTVIVNNSVGSTMSNAAMLTVNPITVGPSITTQPANQTVLVNDTASFSVVATGTAPLSYQWQKNGVAISGATSSTYTSIAALSDSASQYRAIVTNSAGSAMSNAATLTVNPIPASITTQPANQTVFVNDTASFSVVATGTAPLSYQWQKNGVVMSGATSSTYTSVVAMSDNGSQYRVIVTNGAGSTMSNAATLTVNPIPVSITTQPANQTVFVSDAASFSVVATGTAPLSYQWQKNGVAISGATSSTYTSVAALSDNGSQYTVIVNNSAGSTMSNAALLTVNPKPCTTLQFNQAPSIQAPGIPGIAGTDPISLAVPQQPGSALVFHKFVRGSSACVPATEFEISVHCPSDLQPCASGTSVTLAGHWVCPAQNQVCKETNFTLRTTVEGTITFNTENLVGFANVRVPPPPCPEGYLILWVVNTQSRAIKFDSLVGHAVLRWNEHAASSYNALAIQAAANLASNALTDVNADGKMELDGTEYAPVTGTVLGTVRYDAPNRTTPDSSTSTSLTLLTLDVLANRPNNTVYTNINFYDANENLISESINFTCWTEIPLSSIDPSLTQDFMGRNGFFSSSVAVKVPSSGIADVAGPVTLLGIIDNVECTATTATSCIPGGPVPRGDDSLIINNYMERMYDDGIPIPGAFEPNDGSL